MTKQINIANPGDSDFYRNRYVLAFGAYGDTLVMAYADSLEDALEECASWLADNAPGHIIKHGSPEHMELFQDACKELEVDPESTGLCEETVWATAEADLTYTESGFLTSYEWTIVLERPDRKTLMGYCKDWDLTIAHK